MLLLLATLTAAAPQGGLDLAALTRQVLAANPEAEVAAATLAQARARIDAASPWPAPMIDASVAPASLGSMPGWQVTVREDLPGLGERRAARDMAEADADAAAARQDRMRLDLAEMAAMAWADWYTVHRELALTDATLEVLRQTRATTLARVATGRAADLDVLQVDAETGWLRTRAQALATTRDVVAIRINTLTHRPTDSPVDAPPATLEPAAPALEGARPEPAESAAMTRAAEAQARMARAERLPMVGVMGGWDTMQAMTENRWMTGVSVRVPLDGRAASARIAAAGDGVRAARAEAAGMDDRVAERVAIAARTLRGETEVLATLAGEVLPVATARVTAARAGWASGTVDLRQVLEAERAGLDVAIRLEQQRAAVVLRVRELEIARGILLPGAEP
jgi:outer membrane protein